MISLLLAGCLGGGGGFVFDLPAGVPPPRVPEDNPMTAEKVELGRRLFYDVRMSVDGDMACASCHIQALAFTDGKGRAVGTTGEVHPRGSMSLSNAGYSPRFGWASSATARLEHQALIPMFGDDPIEMGMADKEDELVARLMEDAETARLVGEVWDGELTVPRITQALASFERTLLSFDSPYDRFTRGDKGALTVEEQQGMELFFSERLECFHCHGGPTFSDTMDHAKLTTEEVAFHNTALYPPGSGGVTGDEGLFKVTGKASDSGRFKAPTLRNIAQTAPYMHDGSIADLGGVVEHYSLGGRAGTDHPVKSEFVMGFILSEAEKQAVIAFLGALTDEGFLADPRFSDPFEEK